MSLPDLIVSGDADAIAGFRDAHINQVRAYCAVACPPELVEQACDGAFLDFLGRAVTSAPAERDFEQLLLKGTRSAAAARFHVPAAPPSPRPDQCAIVPELLAARANGELADAHTLTAHIKHCPRCQATAALAQRADAAFQSALGWEEPADAATEPAPPQAPPPASSGVIRARRGGLVGQAKKLRDQLGGRGSTPPKPPEP